MATVRHLGLFPRRFGCPSVDLAASPLVAGDFPEIWMPPEYALAMYWRVKKWRFSLNLYWAEIDQSKATWEWAVSREFEVGQASVLTQYQDYNTETETAGPIVDTVNILSNPIDETERKLVCGVDPATYELTEYPDFGDPITATITSDTHFYADAWAQRLEKSGGSAGFVGTLARATIQWPFNSAPCYVRINAGKKEILPAIKFEAETLRWDKIRPFKWSGGNEPLATPYGIFQYELLGKTFQTDVWAYNSRSTEPGFSNTLGVFFSLEALEYWPYDPKDGLGPIYDRYSGDQIRAFPA